MSFTNGGGILSNFFEEYFSHLNIGFLKIWWQNFILLLDAVEVHKITRPRPQTQRHHSSISFCFGRYEMMCVECSFVKLRAIKVLNLMKVFTRLEMVWSKSEWLLWELVLVKHKLKSTLLFLVGECVISLYAK